MIYGLTINKMENNTKKYQSDAKNNNDMVKEFDEQEENDQLRQYLKFIIKFDDNQIKKFQNLIESGKVNDKTDMKLD